MAEISINGTRRTEFGKGASRRDRRAGLVPAVIYGHGAAPQHVALPARELGAALKQSNVLLDVVVDGQTELTLPKSVTRHPLTSALSHIDLIVVRRGEKVIVEHNNNSIQVEVEATSIPAFLTLDMTGLAAGLSLYAKDVVLPAGVVLISDPMMPVVHLSEKSAAAEEVAAPAADAAVAPAADAEPAKE